MKKIFCVLVVFLVISGFSFAKGEGAEKETAVEAAVKESPLLAEMVAKGEIPPLEKRLPAEPMVVEPVEELGEYGGTIRFLSYAVAGLSSEWFQIAHEPLLLTDTYNTKLLPNIVVNWDMSVDGRVHTFYLRKGIRWSDGAPFTANDVLFWYEDILLNEELTPNIWGGYKSGGEVMKMKKLDDYTYQVSFKEPLGFFPWLLGKDNTYYPAHYFKQFHPKYTSKDQLDKLVKEAGFESWSQLFKDKDTNRQEGHPDRPTLRAWKSITELSDALFICERNPYYWKVDTQGRQLPYIDRFRGEVVSSRDVWLMKIMNGDVDFNINGVDGAYEELSLLMENQDKGNYNIYKLGGAPPAAPVYFFNHTCNDPVLRELFANVKFKAALSLGIDRDEINNTCFFGIGNPSQGHGNADSSYYVESVAMKYTEYDPAKANKMLDEIGLSKRDADGIRLRSDGKPLTMIVDLGSSDKVTELITDYWTRGLGVKTVIKTMTWAIMGPRRTSGEVQISKSGFYDPVNPWTDQFHALNSKWGWAWQQWLTTDGKEGEEPPEDVKRLYHILNVDGYAAVSDKERDKLMKEVMKLWSDNLWGIGTVGMPFQMGAIKKNLINVPEKAARWYPAGIVAQQPCQWFFKK